MLSVLPGQRSLISRCSCFGRVLRDLSLELSCNTFLLSFLSDPGYFQFSTSCLAIIFGEIGQFFFFFVDDLPVSLLMEFQALLDECVKLMLLFLTSVHIASHSGNQTELLQLSVSNLSQ